MFGNLPPLRKTILYIYFPYFDELSLTGCLLTKLSIFYFFIFLIKICTIYIYFITFNSGRFAINFPLHFRTFWALFRR